ncbi:MAG: 4-oxalocrotonate tautomerase [Synergistaceae bacterium]|jgi:4-oxalocrotonate tautomerase|nr:4-oxalocrotonate tautomerase [Synergistaceae bacterium]
MDIPKEAFIVLVSENPQENVGVGGMLLADKKQDCSGEAPAEKPKRSGSRLSREENRSLGFWDLSIGWG